MLTALFVFLGFVLGVAMLSWLLAPIWDRPYLDESALPRAAIAGTVDLTPRLRRRPPTSGETLRIIVGCLGLGVVAILAYELYDFLNHGFWTGQ